MLDLAALGIIQDFQFMIQLFIAISIASFVLNHLGKGVPSIAIIGALFYIVFVMIPALAEATFIIYILLMSGVSALIVDFFFLRMNMAPQPGGGHQQQDVTGIDIQNRQHMIHQAQHAARPRMGR